MLNNMFPIIYLLYTYATFALLGLLFLFFNLYHMAQFGLQEGKTYFFILAYILVFLTAMGISLLFLVQIDWSQEVNLGEIILDLVSVT